MTNQKKIIDMDETIKCHRDGCSNTIPAEMHERYGKLYCSDYCRKSAQNSRCISNRKQKKLGNTDLAESQTNQQNDTIMGNENNNALEIVGQRTAMPAPTSDPTLAYIIKDLESRLSTASVQVAKWQNKADLLRDENLKKDSEIADLKRELARKDDELQSKQGLGGLVDGLKDNEGKIDFAGLGQMFAGVVQGIKGSAAPAQLAGSDQPQDEHVQAFAAWWPTLDEGTKTQVWPIIEAMATNPDLISEFQNMMNDGNYIRKAAN